MNKAYLLLIVYKSPNEYSDQVVYHSVYKDEELARHFMFKDIMEQFKNGRIKNVDGLVNKMAYYKSDNIEWRIERLLFIDGIK